MPCLASPNWPTWAKLAHACACQTVAEGTPYLTFENVETGWPPLHINLTLVRQTRFHIGEAPVSQSPIPCSPCPLFLTSRTSVEPPIPPVFRRATRHRRASPPLAHSPLRCRGGHDPVGPPHGGGKTVGEGNRRFSEKWLSEI